MARRFIRGTHPDAYRSDEWAEILATESVEGRDGRECYLVRFPDGVTDTWPVDDLDAGYEFRAGDANE